MKVEVKLEVVDFGGSCFKIRELSRSICLETRAQETDSALKTVEDEALG